jgi:type IV secretory pathway VirB10-like protein
MKRLLASILFCVVTGLVVAPSVGWAKTDKECNAEWKANKDAIKAQKEKKKDFMAACKAGTETIPAPATPPPAPPPAAPPPPAPPPAAPQTRAPETPQKPVPPVSHAAPTKSNEFTTEAAAKARCPSGTVVWVNTKSGVYHFAGTHNYGTTKSGAYMCETDTAAAGYRAAKNEKHP